MNSSQNALFCVKDKDILPARQYVFNFYASKRYQLFIGFIYKAWVLISSPGTSGSRAVRKPPRRFAPAGSPLALHSRRSLRAFRSNQRYVK